MAATMTTAGELTYLSFPITKTETNADGDIFVYGKASDGSVDSDEQIVDPEWTAKAVQDWLASGANVRVQHNAQRDPAGIGIEATTGADGDTWVKSLVVEPVAKTLVSKGALRAYSVGIARPKIVRDAVARGGRIVGGELVEISLVDRPANKNCGIQLVKSDKDGHAEWVGKAFGATDTLIKGLAPEASSAFSPADLAKLLTHRALAEKRNVDPNVGGGTDRDKIPAADFAGRDRSFPIVTPGDVSDAAASIGRAGAANYSSDELRRRITSIAHRKGPSFVAELPESWKSETVEEAEPVTEKADDTDVDKAKLTAAVTDEYTDEGEGTESATKGKKDCPSCGKDYDADAKERNCEGCGKSLPKGSDKADDADAVKAGKACTDCGNKASAGDNFCPKCGCKMVAEPDAEKGKPSPGDGVSGMTTQAVPAHREPDGSAIEALESDAGMPTTPDSTVKAADRLKSIGVPDDLGTLHDLTCPVFHPDVAAKSYPTGLSAIDVEAWQAKAIDAAFNATLAEAGQATQLWQHAVTLKSVDNETYTQLRLEAHKSFTDANGGPGTFPTPTELTATRFRRPLITAGQAKPGTAYDGPNTHAVPTSQIDASQFTQGFQQAGRAADSPSNKSNDVVSVPSPAGVPQRVVYTEAQTNLVRSAMAAMHDHVAQTFPDVCSMAGPGQGGQPPVGARPVPVAKAATVEEPVTAPATPVPAVTEPVFTELIVGEPVVKAVTEEAVTKAISAGNEQLLTLIKGMQTEFNEKLQAITEELAAERELTGTLQKSVDALGDLPDPATAPFRGVAQHPTTSKAAGRPAGVLSVAETAERTQLEVMKAMQQQARYSPNPGDREAAWDQLYKMNGLPTT